MKKIILILFIGIFLVSFVSAFKLTDLQKEQMSYRILNDCKNDEVIDTFCEHATNYINCSYVSYVINSTIINWYLDLIDEKFRNANYFGSIALVCASSGNITHSLVLNGNAYLWDNEDISTISHKSESYYASTSGDNSPAIIGNDNTVVYSPWYVNLFWSEGTIGGAILMLILGAIVWILKKFIWEWLKIKIGFGTKK